MKKKKASANDFDELLGGGDAEISNVAPSIPKPAVEVEQENPVSSKRGRGKPKTSANDCSTTIYYPSKWRKRLKEQALHEDVSVNDLYVEGLRLLFANRGINPDSDK